MMATRGRFDGSYWPQPGVDPSYNSQAAPIIDQFAEALRKELLGYAHLLELLQEQQLTFLNGGQRHFSASQITGYREQTNSLPRIHLHKTNELVQVQAKALTRLKQDRERWNAVLLRFLHLDSDASWDDFMANIPTHQQFQIQALAEAINHTVEKVLLMVKFFHQQIIRALRT